MPQFKNGTYVNKCNDGKRPYLRISAGPQRGRYVHDVILEAIIQRDLKPGETAEHIHGDGLNVHWTNIGRKPVFRRENTALMHKRRKRVAKTA